MSLQVRAVFKPRGDLGQFVRARVTPVVRMAVEESAQLVFDRSQALVHVDSGELKASGHVEIVETDKTVVGKVIYDAPHAFFNEFGTGVRGASSPDAGPGPYDPNWPGMDPIPFLRPAIDSSREEVKQIFANDLEVGLK